MRKIFVAVGLLGVGFGVYQYYITQLKILEKWNYRITGGRLISANPTRVEIQVDIEVTNNSTIGLTITDYFFDVFLNGEKVAEVKNASINQILNANGGKSFFPLNIVINTAQFLRGNVLLGLIDSIKESKLNLSGHFGIKKGFLRFKNIPINETFKLEEFM